MPKRTDISSILIIGAGPIVIGQASEFDYSGTQAVKALKAEGYRIILINSNPATIMTDPELADRTYIEPLSPPWVRMVIERDRPDALLPTMGGQTALNLAMALEQDGTLREFGVELADSVEVRVWDSTAELRYMVIPQRPPGTDHLSDEELAELVSRDAMIGVALVKAPQMSAG